MPLRRLAWFVPVAVFFLNPALACNDGPEFQYGAEEMRAAVEGNWSLTLTPNEDVPQQLMIRIEQDTKAAGQAAAAPVGAVVRAAHACGTRTLVKSAGACVDISEMPLKVTMLSGDSLFEGATLSGNFTIHSLVFVVGELRLRVGETTVTVQVSPEGVPSNAGFFGGTATVVHQAAI